MYSHAVNNPNNLIIEQNNFYAIPFGHRCTSAIACNFASIRKFSLPFDWLVPLFPKKIQHILENNFNDFIPDVRNNIFLNKYDVHLAHFNSNIDTGIEEYMRRICRFDSIMNEQNKKYFIYINEDYLYNKDFRTDSLNNNIFNEMLELECFLKEKYTNIDYAILYFNFKHHTIPSNSNIIKLFASNSLLKS